MKSKKQKAIQSFRSGLNCAQSVLTAFSDDLEFDYKLALNVSSGFGGGMGKLQETCGAVTGAFMVIGIYNSNTHTDTKIGKDKSESMIQAFSTKFKAINGTQNCSSLLKCDLKTEEGRTYATDNGLFETVCEKCVSDSVAIIEELIKK
jgi:C_GCAxxG_C_C family probable redox protein